MRKTLLLALVSVFCLLWSDFVHAGRCVENADRTVTDNSTGLIWQKATAGPMNWDEAMRFVQGRTLGAYSGFRLPGRDELQGLYHSPCLQAMHVESDWYWSSTTEPDYEECAWGVNVELRVWEGMFHGFELIPGLPEGQEARKEMALFLLEPKPR